MFRHALQIAAALVLLSAAGTPYAAPLVAGYGEGDGVDFALHLQSTSLDVDFDNAGTADFDQKTLGVSWYEALTERLDGGIELGYAEITQSGEPLLAGRSPDGYFIGVLLRLHAYRSPALRLDLDAAYRYLNVEDGSVDPRVRLSWRTARAGVGVGTPVARGLWVIGRAYYATLDGERLVRGSVSSTEDFSARRGLGYALGMAVDLGREGDFRVQWEEGHASGVTLSFSRRF